VGHKRLIGTSAIIVNAVIQGLTNAYSEFLAKWYLVLCVSKDKAVPLQTWSGTEGSRNLRFPDFMTTAQVGGRVVSLTPRKCSWYLFLLEAESTPGP